MVHQGTDLKKRRKVNPNLKRPDAILYRDLEKQNDWLRSNVFDSMGNYLEEVEEQSPGDYIIMPERNCHLSRFGGGLFHSPV